MCDNAKEAVPPILYSNYKPENNTIRIIPTTAQPTGKIEKSKGFKVQCRRDDDSYFPFSMISPCFKWRLVELISKDDGKPYLKLMSDKLDENNKEHMDFKNIIDNVRNDMINAFASCKPCYKAIPADYISKALENGNIEPLEGIFSKFIVPSYETKGDTDSKITGYSFMLNPASYKDKENGDKRVDTFKVYTYDFVKGKEGLQPVQLLDYEYLIARKESGDKKDGTYIPAKRAPAFNAYVNLYSTSGFVGKDVSPRLVVKEIYIEEIFEVTEGNNVSKSACQIANIIKLDDKKVNKNNEILDALRNGISLEKSDDDDFQDNKITIDEISSHKSKEENITLDNF